MKFDLEVLRLELEAALRGLDCQHTQLTPLKRRDKWSIQQIVSHLLKTYAATEYAMDARLVKRTPTAASTTLRQRAGQFLLLRVGYFPQGRVAPEMVEPPLNEDAASSDTLIARVTTALSVMDAKIVACETIFGSDKRTIRHMVLGPLSVDQWRRFHLVHGRHHIKQIAAIRKDHHV